MLPDHAAFASENAAARPPAAPPARRAARVLRSLLDASRYLYYLEDTVFSFHLPLFFMFYLFSLYVT